MHTRDKAAGDADQRGTGIGLSDKSKVAVGLDPSYQSFMLSKSFVFRRGSCVMRDLLASAICAWLEKDKFYGALVDLIRHSSHHSLTSSSYFAAIWS